MPVAAIDGHVLTGKYQGSRTWLSRILREIGRLDQSTRYLLYSYDPAATAAEFPYANFEHKHIPVRNPVLRLLGFWPYARWRDGFDVLLTQYISPPFMAGAQIVAIHDILFESHPRLFPWLMRWRNKLLVAPSARRARFILTVSEFTQREIVRRYGVSSDRILLAANGVDRIPAPAERSAPGSGSPYILCVGRLEPRKNIETLLEALPQLETPGVRLVIVGAADFGAEVTEARIAEREDVIRLRNVSDEQLDRLYRDAGVLVFPSLAEGFGIPVIEALSRGIPVVASDQTAIPEVGGAFARYFNPQSPHASRELAKRIDEALATGLPRSEELKTHLARFSWEKAARAVLFAFGARCA